MGKVCEKLNAHAKYTKILVVKSEERDKLEDLGEDGMIT